MNSPIIHKAKYRQITKEKKGAIQMKHHHFNTNENLKQLTEKTLIIGVDVSKKIHVARAVDYRGMELSKTFAFQSDIKGFLHFHSWIRELRLMKNKTNLIIGLEPSGVYGNTLIQYLRGYDIKVVLVLGSQVAKAKELDDNSPSKNDPKDAITICGLVRDGRFRKLREFSDEISELKVTMAINRQLTKDITRVKCRIDNWLTQYFPEFTIAFKDWTLKTALLTLKICPMPKDITTMPPGELVRLWREAGVIKGIGIKKADELRHLAKNTAGITSAPEFAEMHIRTLLSQYELYIEQMEELWAVIDTLVKDIPLYDILSGIPHIGKKAVCGIIAEIGDPTEFEHPNQLIRLAGLSLKEASSGNKKGQSKITKRGRPMLRHWLYIAVLELLKWKEPTFWALHQYYTTRKDNPLKKMQSVTALCCRLLRIIHGMSISGAPFDPQRVTAGIPALKAA